MDLKKRAKQIKKDIPAVFLALKNKDTPILAKILAGITVGYALSPIDFIPDFIPVLGVLDDIILLPLFITCVVKLIPPRVMEQCREEAEDLWKDGKPKKWYYAIPIVAVWLLVILVVVKIIWL